MPRIGLGFGAMGGGPTSVVTMDSLYASPPPLYDDDMPRIGLGFGAPPGFAPAFNGRNAAPAAPLAMAPSRFGGSASNARVKHPFKAHAADELDVRSGERLEVVKQIDREWAQCRNERGQLGIVPLNVLKRDYHLRPSV
jgi:hypothetical protein